jgi:NAD(P)-dependent dehydrogenase (short-subunit alcohol dehydrogenase family)
MTHPDIRIALVTGANKGIGLEIARQLGMQGMRVLVGARDQDRGQAAAAALAHEGISARDVQLDLTEPATIGSAAADIEAREGRLDILINNAGITSSGDGSPGTAFLEAMRRTFDTNFFRHAGRDAGDAAAAEAVAVGAHRQCIERSWFARLQQRPELRIRRL